ncbi:MAG: DUF4198 domain-containing protein [Desulfovibrionaceae bacterium]|nr:DUF4198 domain-containing protein [Desulfovibrionaceae bacterium]
MWKSTLAGCALLLCLASPAQAHFGMVIPSNDMIMEKGEAAISLELAFAHPMEGEGMNLARPQSFAVHGDGATADLLPALKPAKIMGHDGYTVQYTLRRPGVAQFVMTPAPYWEPAEDCFIVHYTKAYAAAFGSEDGWQEPLGLKTEIVPLTRPFGNYAGNTFQGVVMMDGRPVAGCDVEVEFYNRDGRYQAPTPYMVTQVVRTDPDGVFTFTVPFAGWWGFAALNTSDRKMEHDGEMKDVELGAVLWSRFLDPVESRKK